MTAIIMTVVLILLTDISLGEVIYLSVVQTIAAYLIGDLLILPMTNNLIATGADVVIAVLTILLFNDLVLERQIYFGNALVAAVILAAGEWIFHKYLHAAVLPERNREKVPENIDELRR